MARLSTELFDLNGQFQVVESIVQLVKGVTTQLCAANALRWGLQVGLSGSVNQLANALSATLSYPSTGITISNSPPAAVFSGTEKWLQRIEQTEQASAGISLTGAITVPAVTVTTAGTTSAMTVGGAATVPAVAATLSGSVTSQDVFVGTIFDTTSTNGQLLGNHPVSQGINYRQWAIWPQQVWYGYQNTVTSPVPTVIVTEILVVPGS